MILFYEIIKNLKLIFRDIRSLSVLVLGPFTVILLIGYIFSNETPHGIRVGVLDGAFAEEIEIRDLFFKNLSEFAKVDSYDNLDQCLYDLKRTNVHVCIKPEAVKIEDEELFAQKTIQIFSDISRPVLNARIQSEIELIIDLSSENISIQSTQGILESIQELIRNLTARKEQIGSFTSDLEEFQDLVSLKQNLLLNFRSTLISALNELEDLVKILESSSAELAPLTASIDNQMDKLSAIPGQMNEWSNKYMQNFEALKLELQSSLNQMTLANQEALSVAQMYNLELADFLATSGGSDAELIRAIIASNEAFLGQINNLNSGLARLDVNDPLLEENLFTLLQNTADISIFLTKQMEIFSLDANTIQEKFNLMVLQLKKVNQEFNQFRTLLNEEINSNEKILASLASASGLVQEIDKNLSDDLAKFYTLSPSIAQNIIRPIEKELGVIRSVRNIEIFFSSIIVIVVTFIALLFSNIITLTEINSQAHFRTLITPVLNEVFVFGLFFTNVILVLFQLSILLGVAYFTFNINVLPHLIDIYSYSTLLIILYTFIGMVVAYLVKKEQISILISTFLAVAFYLCSNIIWPLELMPPLGAAAANLNPASFSEIVYRHLLIYDVSVFETKQIKLLFFMNLIGFFAVFYASNRYLKKLDS